MVAISPGTVRSAGTRSNVYALVGSGSVANLVVWDGVTTYVPAGYTIVQATADCLMKDTYSNGTFTATVSSQ